MAVAERPYLPLRGPIASARCPVCGELAAEGRTEPGFGRWLRCGNAHKWLVMNRP